MLAFYIWNKFEWSEMNDTAAFCTGINHLWFFFSLSLLLLVFCSLSGCHIGFVVHQKMPRQSDSNLVYMQRNVESIWMRNPAKWAAAQLHWKVGVLTVLSHRFMLPWQHIFFFFISRNVRSELTNTSKFSNTLPAYVTQDCVTLRLTSMMAK